MATRQRQLYAQLTGNELSMELSMEEKMLAVQQAFLGQHCLVVLDDLWDLDHFQYFALIDESTTSRVLVSSRVRGTLVSCGCVITTLSLPTDDDAIEMVMAAAGMVCGPAGPVPAEAGEVMPDTISLLLLAAASPAACAPCGDLRAYGPAVATRAAARAAAASAPLLPPYCACACSCSRLLLLLSSPLLATACLLALRLHFLLSRGRNIDRERTDWALPF
eukprot:SAG31_NODE_8073_length_1528_cov_1.107768_2_plen_220_part_00